MENILYIYNSIRERNAPEWTFLFCYTAPCIFSFGWIFFTSLLSLFFCFFSSCIAAARQLTHTFQCFLATQQLSFSPVVLVFLSLSLSSEEKIYICKNRREESLVSVSFGHLLACIKQEREEEEENQNRLLFSLSNPGCYFVIPLASRNYHDSSTTFIYKKKNIFDCQVGGVCVCEMWYRISLFFYSLFPCLNK